MPCDCSRIGRVEVDFDCPTNANKRFRRPQPQVTPIGSRLWLNRGSPGLVVSNDSGITRRRVFCGGRVHAFVNAGSSFCQNLFILLVRADPEPDDLVRRPSDTHCTVLAADADRNQTIRSMNLFEAQARVTGILNELAICGTSLTANIGRQCGEQLPKARRRV